MRGIFIVLALTSTLAVAQDYPSKSIRLVVPWPPGGNVDITGRTIAPALSDALGQQVVVENRAGAGGTIGTAAVAKSPADGYTLLMGSSGTVTVAPTVYKNIAYDPIKDLSAIGAVHVVPMVLTAASKTPVASYAEFVQYARSGQASIASAGNGSSNHLAIELLMRQAKMKLVHVPYRGSGPAINDMLGSQVDTMIDQLNASIQYIRDGRMKALAVTTAKRSPSLPNVPTLTELGVPGYEASTFTGIFGPANLPAAVNDRLFAALKKALATDAVRERFRGMGVEVQDSTQAEFAAYVRTDYEKWRTLAREANIVVE
jgi:tripartite-type tricarboxylate transporter receptor subunit TctC